MIRIACCILFLWLDFHRICYFLFWVLFTNHFPAGYLLFFSFSVLFPLNVKSIPDQLFNFWSLWHRFDVCPSRRGELVYCLISYWWFLAGICRFFLLYVWVIWKVLYESWACVGWSFTYWFFEQQVPISLNCYFFLKSRFLLCLGPLQFSLRVCSIRGYWKTLRFGVF